MPGIISFLMMAQHLLMVSSENSLFFFLWKCQNFSSSIQFAFFSSETFLKYLGEVFVLLSLICTLYLSDDGPFSSEDVLTEKFT